MASKANIICYPQLFAQNLLNSQMGDVIECSDGTNSQFYINITVGAYNQCVVGNGSKDSFIFTTPVGFGFSHLHSCKKGELCLSASTILVWNCLEDN